MSGKCVVPGRLSNCCSIHVSTYKTLHQKTKSKLPGNLVEAVELVVHYFSTAGGACQYFSRLCLHFSVLALWWKENKRMTSPELTLSF